MRTNLLMERGFLRLLIHNGMSLYKNVVIKTIVPVQNRHHTCNLCPVPDMIRRISALFSSVYPVVHTGADHGKRSKNQVMYHGNTLGCHTKSIA